jgi:hypothetical protein
LKYALGLVKVMKEQQQQNESVRGSDPDDEKQYALNTQTSESVDAIEQIEMNYNLRNSQAITLQQA